MSELTKEEMEKLTGEQQEALADVVVQRMRQRQDLLKQARAYRGRWWFPVVVVAAGCALALIPQNRLLPVFLFVLMLGLIQFHANGLNLRLDALMKLLEAERADTRKS